MPWLLVDLALLLLALVGLALCALRMWRGLTALTRELGRAGTEVGALTDSLAALQADAAPDARTADHERAAGTRRPA